MRIIHQVRDHARQLADGSLKAKKKKIRGSKKRTVAANRLAAQTVFAKMVSLHKG